MTGMNKGFSGFFRVLVAVMLLSVAAGCNDSSIDGETSMGYGGSIPEGDYVTAEINGDQITIKNYQDNTMDTTLGFGGIPEDVPDMGTSIIHVTELDRDAYYMMALVEDRVLALHRMDATLDPISSELPVYLFEKTVLAAEDLKGRSFNFMELFADAEGVLSVEVGIVGFDTDASGRLYGAAYDSEEDAVYSITDEDGIEDSGDEFTLDRMESMPDGALVLWENGIDNWNDATTLTGSTSGSIVLDHGPGAVAGGGAGFAFPQVTETDPDIFWADVTGDYFLIAHYDDGERTQTEYLRCYVAQENPGQWAGILYVSFDLGVFPPDNEGLGTVYQMTITPLDQDETAIAEIENAAGFSSAQSETVQQATQGKGLFQGTGEASDFTVAFDPNGNYIMAVKSGGSMGGFGWVNGFGLGIRDRNWQEGDPMVR